MDTEQTITEIEWLERVFAVPDTRPLSASDLSAANRRHDEMLAHSPWCYWYVITALEVVTAANKKRCLDSG